jgi:hypothetical protein
MIAKTRIKASQGDYHLADINMVVRPACDVVRMNFRPPQVATELDPIYFVL